MSARFPAAVTRERAGRGASVIAAVDPRYPWPMRVIASECLV